MVQLPLGAAYVPPVPNAPAHYVAQSGQTITDAWSGNPATLYGCTIYLSTQGGTGAWRTGSLSATLDTLLATAQTAGLNLIRVTDFFDSTTVTQQWDDPQIWTNLDYLVSAAQLRGMYVLMDVSGWKKWMQSQGGTGSYDPSVAANWTPLLNALGAHYATAKNICWYSIVGEPSVPTDTPSTTALVSFYQSVTDTLAAADANHLITAGGFISMEQHPELSWWQQIYALPHNHICSYKTYSQQDLDYTVFIGRYVATLGKPLSQQEFGAEQLLGDGVWSTTSWNGVSLSVADYYRQVYRRGGEVAASSFVFWNLGFQVSSTGYDISSSTMPATWGVVREAATGVLAPTPIAIAGRTLDIAPGGSPLALYVESGALTLNNAVGQRSALDGTVVDKAGANHFEQGEPVILADDFGRRQWGGVITDAVETQPGQGALLEHALQCADWHYLADKRRFPYANTNVTAGTILADMLSQVLASEGVVAAFGGNALSANQSLGAEEDLQGFVALNNAVLSQDASQVNPNGAGGGLGGSLKMVCDGTQTFQAVEVRIPVQVVPGAAGAQITISAYVRAASGTPSVRFYVQGASGSLGGTTTITLSTTWTRYTWTATMPNPIVGGFLALRVDTGGTAQAVTLWLDGLQLELGASASAWQLGGPATVQAGPTIVEFTSNYATCAECLDALAQAAGTFVWQIDATKRLWFGAQGQQLAPWTATAADMERESIQVERANPLYRNRQFLLGGTDVTSTQTEQRKGDGSATAFTFSYPFAQVPTVTVNGVSKTVGIKGVDTGKDWYWAKGDAVLAQDSAGTKLISTDTLQVVYVGQFPIVIQSDDSSEQTAEQSREGGVGSGTGLVEDVQTDGTLSSSAAGFQVAAGYLARYSQLGKQLTFTTKRSGLAQGQLLTVDLTGTSHDIGPGEQMLIESVTAQHDGLIWWYTVKALEGPINTTWVQFFTALASQAAASVDKINLGASGTLVILASAAAGLSMAVTGSVTITTYALPSPTSYPSPTTYPGSTGAPVALTWTKTQAGLDLLRDVLAGAVADDKVRYLAWGTGTQGAPSTATQLAAEAGRKAITKYTNGASHGEIIIDGLIGPTDGPGTAITEVGLFAGPAAGSGANSGVLLLYGLYSHTHTNTENLDIQADITFS